MYFAHEGVPLPGAAMVIDVKQAVVLGCKDTEFTHNKKSRTEATFIWRYGNCTAN